MAQNNQTLTDIAIKRLSGKANTNAKSSVAQEAIGSTVQTVSNTVFAEAIPNTPTADTASHMFRVQSASLDGPGTVMLVDFEIVGIGDTYENDLSNSVDDLDEGEQVGANTFHAYGLILSGTFETSGALGDVAFDVNASTPTPLGTAPFKDGNFLTGSRGRLQIVPEYVSSDVAGIGGPNKYTPKVFNSTADGKAGLDSAELAADHPIDYYLDPFAGVLFVQDAADAGQTNPLPAGASIPGKVRCFIYVGKYQDEVLGNVDIHISASGGTGFSIANETTASFESGSAGITVTADSSQTITIGDSSDNVFFNDISASGNLFVSKSIFISGDGGYNDATIEVVNDRLEIKDLSTIRIAMDSDGDTTGGSAKKIEFGTGSAGAADFQSLMVVSSSGNVGIGVGSPSAKLHVDGDIIAVGNLVAENYIVSSTIMHMTQSFSDGSTIFGDTNNDTHLFTGSIEILHTGSGNTGLLLSGSTISVDAGSSGSLRLGTHNVGFDVGSVYPITGSGLIVSQSNLPSGHFNMLKVGDVEFVDYTGPGVFPALVIDVKQDRTFIISSSDTNKPVAEFANPADAQGGSVRHRLYSGSAKIFEVGHLGVIVGGTNGSVGNNDVTVLGGEIRLQPNRSNQKTVNLSLSQSVGGESNARYVPVAFSNMDNNAPKPLASLDLRDNAFALIRGNITASAVSSSGLLFASASEEANGGANIRAVVYDTASGQFFFTGSYGSGGESGDTVDLHISASEGTGFSIANSATASFESGSAGITVTAGTTNTITIGASTDNVTFASITSSNGFEGVASSASISNKVQVTNNEATSGDFPITFVDFTGDPSAAPDNTASLQVDASTLTYNPNAGSLRIGDDTDNITIKKDEITESETDGTFALLNTNTDIINFGGEATTITIGAATSTASFAGNLIVQGTTTQLNVENLLVDDQFILLNSGSNTGDGGIIVQTDDNFNGTALFYDDSENRWAITSQSAVGHSNTTAAAMSQQFIVTVSQSAAAPTGNPSDFGNDAASYRGMMYVDTNDSDGDGNIIYIYA